MKKIIAFLLVAFFAMSILSCAVIRQYENGGVPEGKTFSEKELQRAMPALIGFRQRIEAVHDEEGLFTWTGIWVPKDIDTAKGGAYTFLVLLNGNATRQDFVEKKEAILSLYPGVKIVNVNELANTAYYPQSQLIRAGIRYELTGRSIQGDVYDVVIPPQTSKTMMSPDSLKKSLKHSSKKTKHK
ncbi:MAG: hypothetical protein NTZ13_03990 [Candidatus Parcubacteria bacterium]|nr:hypothetical protein [Candidatus Parcubacteria bacterium]